MKTDRILDYHEFYEEFKSLDYLPLRINDEWLDENEEYLVENLYSFYMIYSHHSKPSEIMHMLFRLYADVTLNTYIHFEGRGHYL